LEAGSRDIAHAIRAAAVYAKRLRAEREAERVRHEKAERLWHLERARIERLKERVAQWEQVQRRSYLAVVRLGVVPAGPTTRVHGVVVVLLFRGHSATIWAGDADPPTISNKFSP
jgi:hypothetical protein